MISRRTLLAAIAGAAGAVPAFALPSTTPPEVAAELPGARPQGSGHLRWFGFSVYEARLWVKPGFDPSDFDDSAFALEIVYTRALDGAGIAQRSIAEMERTSPIAPPRRERWLATMREAFPDVKAADRMTGVYRPGESARFFHNGALRAEVRDAEFARRFFGIWFDPETSEPALRRALLGGGRAMS